MQNHGRSRIAFAGALMASCLVSRAETTPPTTLKLMSYNILSAADGVEGVVTGKRAFDKTVEAIKAAKADIIAVSEVRREDPKTSVPFGASVAPLLAKALGYYYFDQSSHYAADAKRTGDHPAIWANAILSRYPIEKGTPLGLGAVIQAKGRRIHVFSLNLDYKPYPPYQINKIEYEGYPFITTEQEAIHFANVAHKAALDELSAEIRQETQGSDAVFVMGDFNEPSHLDWTARAAASKVQTAKVAWPTTRRLESMGFVDTYRAAFPDEVAKPGLTWTPTTKEDDPQDHHDRIDFVFAKAPRLKVISSAVVGEKPERADIVIKPWPSDHRAVVSTVRF